MDRGNRRENVKQCNRSWIHHGVFGSNFESSLALLEIVNQPQTSSNISQSERA